MGLIMKLWAIISILAITVSCNRFDNKFEPYQENNHYQDRLNDFTLQLEFSFQKQDVNSIMEYYSDEYLNDGKDKEAVADYFEKIVLNYPDSFFVSIESTDYSNLSFTYSILAFGTDNKQDITTVLDTTIVEYTSSQENNYLFIGNQQDAIESPERRVLVELFTALWCPNCPYVEAALHSLKQQYRDNFYYIEYHRMDKYDFGNEDIASYYNVSSLPVGIIQGSTRITGGSEANSYVEYNYGISEYFGKEANFHLDSFEYSISENVVSFSLDVKKNVEVGDNVKLKYALLEKESSTKNAAGETVRNIVVNHKYTSLLEDMFSPNQALNGERVANLNLEITVPDILINNPALILWIQNIDYPYDEETCIVYNVQEFELLVDK